MNSWKLKLPIVIALGLLAWWAAVGLQKQLLVQYDGHTIIAEETWEEGGKIYYIRGIEILWVDASQVLEIIQGSFTNPAAYLPLLTAHLGDTLKRFNPTREAGPTLGSRLRGLVVPTGIFIAWIAGALLLGFLAFLGIKWGLKLSMAKIKIETDPTSRPVGFQPLLAGISDVEALFLNLYREKLGAAPDAPSEVSWKSAQIRPRRALGIEVTARGGAVQCELCRSAAQPGELIRGILGWRRYANVPNRCRLRVCDMHVRWLPCCGGSG